MNREEFIKELQKLDINISPEQLEQLERLFNILVEENKKTNLTRIIEKEDVYLKHFYDSLTITKVVNLNSINTLCDVGSGAGFPGLVIKIMYPHLEIVLIDSLLKRVKYLNETIKKLDLTGIEAIHTRAEDYHAKKFDLVTARAVANIDKLLDYTMHLVKKEGKFIAMKGNIDKEITPDIEKKISNKYIIDKIIEFELPIENSKRSLVVIKNK
ncbi:MAG: 16S rRNA (guanine(527)-N(7))-methyltransferase RsmG [Bacilli bacterium]|nr:16S rRNA (guanine(527)-N(7))-methyltransferase RsmG [Bacilli bacterium]